MRLFCLLLSVLLLCLVAAPPARAAETEKRPKIGLALSGGGARGGAHIGVLKALEKLQVPIDYIAGTSMGAIVGGFYAAGYSPEEIEDILGKMDWSGAFSDEPERSGVTMRKKELDANLLIPHRLGFNRGSLQLPLGMIEGQKLDQIFQRVLLPVRDIHDFNDLRIPFRALATDLATGGEVVLGSGSLADAIRASMSIPGVFAPVILNDRMLVDGGMANNLPISVVRDMGADIVIAVDISSPLLTRQQLDSVLTVTEQLTNFLTRKNTEQQLATLGPRDVLLVPWLGDYSTTDFLHALSLVDEGYQAVMISRAGFTGLSQPPAEARPPERDMESMAQKDYIVHFIDIDNRSLLDDEIIRTRLDIEIGQPLDFERLEKSINHIYSIDVFQTVTYDLVANEAGDTGILVNAIPRVWGPNYLQFGIEIADDFAGIADFGFAAAYTRNALNRLGGEFRLELAVGREDLVDVDFYQPVDRKARWFFEPRAFWTRRRFNVIDRHDIEAQLEIAGAGISIGVGRNFSPAELLRLDYEFFRGSVNRVIGDNPFADDDDVHIGELHLQYRHDNQDSLWFPTSGQVLSAGVRVGGDQIGAAFNYEQALVGASLAHTVGRNTALLRFQAGYSFDDTAPLARWFELGGFGRLSGLIPDQLTGPHMGLATLSVYRRLNAIDVLPLYAGFTLEAGNVWQQHDDIGFDGMRTSGSLFVGADTPIGPVYLAYGLADGGENAFYFYLGNPWKTNRY